LNFLKLLKFNLFRDSKKKLQRDHAPNRRTQVKVEFTHIIRRFGVIREEYNLYPRPLDKKMKKKIISNFGRLDEKYCTIARALYSGQALGVRRLIRAQKSVVPAPSDRDPVGETSCDIVLQFNHSDFVKQTRGPIIRTDLCCNLYFNPLLFCKTNPGS
jgi:hypothetical protein